MASRPFGTHLSNYNDASILLFSMTADYVLFASLLRINDLVCKYNVPWIIWKMYTHWRGSHTRTDFFGGSRFFSFMHYEIVITIDTIYTLGHLKSINTSRRIQLVSSIHTFVETQPFYLECGPRKITKLNKVSVRISKDWGCVAVK